MSDVGDMSDRSLDESDDQEARRAPLLQELFRHDDGRSV